MRRIINAGVSNYCLPIHTIRGAMTVYKSNGNASGIHSKLTKSIRKTNLRAAKGICGISKTAFVDSRNRNRF